MSNYNDDVAKLSKIDYDEIMTKAIQYNKRLADKYSIAHLTDDELAEYNKLLNVNSSGVMGTIEIPSINVALPIYHGTSEETLQVAIGHLEWSSLPVGGESTHCVLSGHRGLPSAKLLTDLDKVDEGDIFILTVLNEKLTYEVDRINIVEPDKVDRLGIEKGKDYCTLITCTPYGVNSHRLLVRGHRIANSDDGSITKITSDATIVEPMIIATIIVVPLLAVLFTLLMIFDKKKAKNSKSKKSK